MMKLSLMQAIVASVSATGTSALADQLLTAWPHDPGSAKYLRTSANALFSFTQAQQPYVLRFNHEAERSTEQISAEIAYLQHLAVAGVLIAPPVRSIAGRYVESIDTPNGSFHCVVFAAIAGQQYEIEALTLDMYSQWGQTLGKLHAAAQTYAHAGRPTWQDHFAWLAANVPASEHAVNAAIAKLRAQLDALPINTDNFGLIHFDFELDNIIWAERGPTVIDFDDSAWYWFAADIAFALRDLFDDDVTKIDLGSAPLLAFIAGYRTEKAITAADIALLPVFLRLHHIILFAKLLRALGTEPPSAEPAWAAALRTKIEQKIQRYRDECAEIED